VKNIIRNIIYKTSLYRVYLWLFHFETQKKQKIKFKKIYDVNISTSSLNHFDLTKRTIFLDLEEHSLALYLIGVLYVLGKRGFNIVVKDNYKFISQCNFSKSIIFQFDFLTVKKEIDFPDDTIILYDKIFKKKKYSEKLIKVFVSSDIFHRKFNFINEITLPFSHHPENFINKQYENIETYRKNKKSIWCFFSGNYDVDTYRNPKLNNFFRVENRYDLIQEIKEHFDKNTLEIIQNTSELSSLCLNEKKIVLTDWTWHPRKGSVELLSRVQNDKWLDVLSRNVFFLGLPGVHMPMCHNLIEAMSVGVIPVLEYADHFFPKLIHMENAILFKGKRDLISKIEMIMKLEGNVVSKIRENVISYYEDHLNPSKVVEKITQSGERDFTMYYFDEYKSIDAYYLRENNFKAFFKFTNLKFFIKKSHIKTNLSYDNSCELINLDGIDKIHYGCGANFISGWLNVDLYIEKNNDFYFAGLNLVEKHPFLNDSFTFGYSEDFIEHLDQKDQLIFLIEVYRTFKKDGVLRLSFPGLEGVLNQHYSRIDFLSAELAKQEAYVKWNHLHFFSFEELSLVCRHIGFSKIEKVNYGKSNYDVLKNLEIRVEQIETNSYIEITK
jgi:predicted SAM-dependent methyltransferase